MTDFRRSLEQSASDMNFQIGKTHAGFALTGRASQTP
jgi:hypothetical protein